MIYWGDVRESLLKYCPSGSEEWTLLEVIHHLNKQRHLSLKAIAELTGGLCGRTQLFLKMKELTEAKRATRIASGGSLGTSR